MRATAILLALLSLTGPVLGQNPQKPPVESTTNFLFRVTIPKGSTGEDVVCILCSAKIQGRLTGDLVLIGGNADVTGSVDGDVVVVGGRLRTRGTIGGEAFTLGGSISRGPGAQIKGEAESVPWLHLPGQRSFHPLGVLCLVGGVLVFVYLAGLIWRRERSESLANLLARRWWLALLVGVAVWYLYAEFLDEYETSSTLLESLLLALLVLLFIATWFGFYGLAWTAGRRVSRTAAWKTRLAGALILSAGLFIPVVGLVVLFLILTVGLGAGLLFTWPSLRRPRPVAIHPSAPETP